MTWFEYVPVDDSHDPTQMTQDQLYDYVYDNGPTTDPHHDIEELTVKEIHEEDMTK